jgi:hypothetical protein
VLLVGAGQGVVRPFLIGAPSSRPGLLPVNRNPAAASDLKTTVKLRPDSFERWLKLARPYFGSMPVLRALDTNRDFALSPSEIGNAPSALRRLDTSQDGRLTAQECGLHIDPNFVAASMTERVQRQFMSYHPVLAALDADRDGEISAGEIDRAAAALKTLDSDRDGYVTADELIPFPIAFHAGLR